MERNGWRRDFGTALIALVPVALVGVAVTGFLYLWIDPFWPTKLLYSLTH